jgi:transposase
MSSPYVRGCSLTMIGAISIGQVEAAMYGEWSANGEIFLNFLERLLCPNLHSGHAVIMDNVKFHQVKGVKELIESKGARLIYLPPYSPELNPIEEMWSKIKTILRKISARTIRAFGKSIKVAFESVCGNDLDGWFRHSGYC